MDTLNFSEESSSSSEYLCMCNEESMRHQPEVIQTKIEYLKSICECPTPHQASIEDVHWESLITDEQGETSHIHSRPRVICWDPNKQRSEMKICYPHIIKEPCCENKCMNCVQQIRVTNSPRRASELQTEAWDVKISEHELKTLCKCSKSHPPTIYSTSVEETTWENRKQKESAQKQRIASQESVPTLQSLPWDIKTSNHEMKTLCTSTKCHQTLLCCTTAESPCWEVLKVTDKIQRQAVASKEKLAMLYTQPWDVKISEDHRKTKCTCTELLCPKMCVSSIQETDDHSEESIKTKEMSSKQGIANQRRLSASHAQAWDVQLISGDKKLKYSPRKEATTRKESISSSHVSEWDVVVPQLEKKTIATSIKIAPAKLLTADVKEQFWEQKNTIYAPYKQGLTSTEHKAKIEIQPWDTKHSKHEVAIMCICEECQHMHIALSPEILSDKDKSSDVQGKSNICSQSESMNTWEKEALLYVQKRLGKTIDKMHIHSWNYSTSQNEIKTKCFCLKCHSQDKNNETAQQISNEEFYNSTAEHEISDLVTEHLIEQNIEGENEINKRYPTKIQATAYHFVSPQHLCQQLEVMQSKYFMVIIEPIQNNKIEQPENHIEQSIANKEFYDSTPQSEISDPIAEHPLYYNIEDDRGKKIYQTKMKATAYHSASPQQLCRKLEVVLSKYMMANFEPIQNNKIEQPENQIEQLIANEEFYDSMSQSEISDFVTEDLIEQNTEEENKIKLRFPTKILPTAYHSVSPQQFCQKWELTESKHTMMSDKEIESTQQDQPIERNNLDIASEAKISLPVRKDKDKPNFPEDEKLETQQTSKSKHPTETYNQPRVSITSIPVITTVGADTEVKTETVHDTIQEIRHCTDQSTEIQEGDIIEDKISQDGDQIEEHQQITEMVTKILNDILMKTYSSKESQTVEQENSMSVGKCYQPKTTIPITTIIKTDVLSETIQEISKAIKQDLNYSSSNREDGKPQETDQTEENPTHIVTDLLMDILAKVIFLQQNQTIDEHKISLNSSEYGESKSQESVLAQLTESPQSLKVKKLKDVISETIPKTSDESKLSEHLVIDGHEMCTQSTQTDIQSLDNILHKYYSNDLPDSHQLPEHVQKISKQDNGTFRNQFSELNEIPIEGELSIPESDVETIEENELTQESFQKPKSTNDVTNHEIVPFKQNAATQQAQIKQLPKQSFKRLESKILGTKEQGTTKDTEMPLEELGIIVEEMVNRKAQSQTISSDHDQEINKLKASEKRKRKISKTNSQVKKSSDYEISNKRKSVESTTVPIEKSSESLQIKNKAKMKPTHEQPQSKNASPTQSEQEKREQRKKISPTKYYNNSLLSKTSPKSQSAGFKVPLHVAKWHSEWEAKTKVQSTSKEHTAPSRTSFATPSSPSQDRPSYSRTLQQPTIPFPALSQPIIQRTSTAQNIPPYSCNIEEPTQYITTSQAEFGSRLSQETPTLYISQAPSHVPSDRQEKMTFTSQTASLPPLNKIDLNNETGRMRTDISQLPIPLHSNAEERIVCIPTSQAEFLPPSNQVYTNEREYRNTNISSIPIPPYSNMEESSIRISTSQVDFLPPPAQVYSNNEREYRNTNVSLVSPREEYVTQPTTPQREFLTPPAHIYSNNEIENDHSWRCVHMRTSTDISDQENSRATITEDTAFISCRKCGTLHSPRRITYQYTYQTTNSNSLHGQQQRSAIHDNNPYHIARTHYSNVSPPRTMAETGPSEFRRDYSRTRNNNEVQTMGCEQWSNLPGAVVPRSSSEIQTYPQYRGSLSLTTSSAWQAGRTVPTYTNRDWQNVPEYNLPGSCNQQTYCAHTTQVTRNAARNRMQSMQSAISLDILNEYPNFGVCFDEDNESPR
ncbi:hypothetical protein C0J52_00181 [Blattella germanica]|nr:hypothetical protein C0J52_00181 [Blattella germanica]